jgi:hypothetical protein
MADDYDSGIWAVRYDAKGKEIERVRARMVTLSSSEKDGGVYSSISFERPMTFGAGDTCAIVTGF